VNRGFFKKWLNKRDMIPWANREENSITLMVEQPAQCQLDRLIKLIKKAGDRACQGERLETAK
jgi:hypothetical protein